MKKSLLFAAGMALAVMPMTAQRLSSGYVAWPSSQSLPEYVQQWNGGNGSIQVDGKTWEDANFFISRVKPKERFYNSLTQVYPSMTQYDAESGTGTDKRLVWWVPCGDPSYDGQTLNALADGIFDGEMFDMWAYVDHWGNWNCPYGWTPGNFADVAHKNGVGVSGVASVPFGNLGNWGTVFRNTVSLGGETVGKFLNYFGQDGLGYNSEWGGTGAHSSLKLTQLHNELRDYMATTAKNPLWEVMWYCGVGDSGGNYFDQGISSFTELYKGASMFLNYNWNSASRMTSDIARSKTAGKNPFYIYAGMNMQGGEPRSGQNYELLKDYQHSIGLWGAHTQNMFWQHRQAKGSSDAQKASTYLNQIHQWFGNGPLNPAIKKTITNNRTHSPNDDWAGISSMMTARSTLSWDLTTEPFYTFFNIGNGTFFNWKGERQNNNAWHNIGVQDYMPTWHWWWAPEFGQTDVEASAVSMNSDITWEDAYVGGSCLKISGSSAKEYLHLFKTNFAVNSGTILRLTFKILGGKADLKFSMCNGTDKVDAKSREKSTAYVFTAAQCEDLEDASFKSGAAGWQTVEVKVPNIRNYNNMSLLALCFENAENLEMLIGGLEIERNASFATPAAPQLTLAKVLANNVNGVDAKLIWNMPNNKPAGEACYNSDVNVSMFQMWAQQEGEEPIMMGLTTSWAGIEFAIPNNAQGTQRMRFGVAALSPDTKTSSEITWSDYMTLGDYVTVENITINKNIIKPNEKFELSFVDPQHASATWALYDQDGTELWSGNGVSVECPGLPAIGAYNLKVTSNGNTTEYPRYVSISSESVGALPEIYSLSIDNSVVDSEDVALSIDVNEAKTFSYTGREADGSASRGVDLNETWFGVQCGEVGVTANSAFSVAGWVKYDELPTGRSNFITIEDRINGGWPYNNWGYFWSRINDEGKFLYDGVDTGWGWRAGSGTEGNRIYYRYDDAKIDVGAWTHVAIVFDYTDGNKMRSTFYINGVKQLVSQYVGVNKGSFEGSSLKSNWLDFASAKGYANAYGENTYEPEYITHQFPLTSNYWITFGGSSQNITAAKGCVDDFQIWGKAMTDDEVLASMNGLDKDNLPADVLGFWDFEEPANSDNSFPGRSGSSATNKAPKSYLYTINSGGENSNQREYQDPSFLAGSPFISGTAYPVVTKPTWSTRRAEVVGDGTGSEGEATISWNKPGDYEVELTLANGHGEAKMTYPVIKVGEEVQGINDVELDADGFATYTIEDALFVEFDNDGAYDVEVYNTAGVLIGKKAVDIVAGQNVSIALGNQGVYLVKVVRNGELLRTVKVVRK